MTDATQEPEASAGSHSPSASPDETLPTEPERSADATSTDTAGSRLRAGQPLTLLALTAALLAVAGTGFLWWQYRQFYVALADADAEIADALERVRATQRASADQSNTLDAALRRHDQTLRELDGRVDAVPGRLAEVERRIDALQGGTFDARATWLRAEAEYYLALANAALTLAGNSDTARAALALADDRLRETGDPSLGAIRDLVADELIALGNVRRVDTEGLAFSLGRLAARASELPLRTEAPERYVADRAPGATEPGFARLWQTAKEAFGSIVRIERRGDDVALALSDEEARLARRQLAAELQIARLALIRREANTYEASLRAARELLAADFNAREAEVENAIELLDELLMVDIAPALPDISRSLSALRARGGAE